MISGLEQNLIYATGVIVVGGTLVVLIWQWWRNRGSDD